jgi:transposase
MKRRKSKKGNVVNEKTLIVAVDIGKSVHYGYMRAPHGKEVKPFPFYNNGHSFNEFWRIIGCFQREQGLEKIVIGFESSGPYAEPLCEFLRRKPVTLVQTNPMHTKRLKELTGNSPNKTDKKDPRVIADIISLGHALTVVVPEGAAAELRRLTHTRERELKNQTADKNRLQHLMFIIFPEFLNILDVSTKSALYLIKHHPAPEDILSLGLESLCAILKKVSCGQLGIERAQKLFEAARTSVGIIQGKRSILIEINHLVDRIECEQRFIESLEEMMKNHLRQIPYSQNILSIHGIGTITTAGIIGEVGDFSEFTTSNEMIKLAGFDLFEVSSGRHKGQRHISKRGRSVMRKLLYYAAVNTVKSHGIMHDTYQKMLNKGKPKTKALIAIARKLLKIIYAIARDKTMYGEHTNYALKRTVAA